MCQIWEHVQNGGVGGGLAHSQMATCYQSQRRNVFYHDPKSPNNPPNLCENNNIMKVTPLICSPESQQLLNESNPPNLVL